ncbi:Hypothetical protein R9X50_00004600 [Acrodontium crateriforme]|uniref:Methyltransferase domain-containing protein n=1 Tax=Acrodontium crateriforme TaxID=150365 RepID=A0AAQ3LX34_9PEZI|nr:Hypothetical protein R9X50_00004600 [Acrodontium crateriforme]
MERDQASDAQFLYDERSVRYDKSWHPRFAKHMIELINLKPGETVLDLACGTGLVSLQAAKIVGPSGSVVGIDISSGMLAQAEKKMSTEAAHDNVRFIRHSITDLESVVELKEKKFDVITCASALVLFQRPAIALKQWTRYLKPRGRLIVDATHPMSQISGIVFERVGNQLGNPIPSYRLPFQKPEDLEVIMKDAGLEDVSTRLVAQLDIQGTEALSDYVWKENETRVENVYHVDDWEDVFEKGIRTNWLHHLAVDEASKEKAKKLFKEEWTNVADSEGKIYEVDGVFVGIGYRKPN